MSQITIYTDGLCEPNPGLGCWGFVIRSEAMTIKGCGSFGLSVEATNNEAEYEALVQALAALAAMGPAGGEGLFAKAPRLVIRSDSELVISQLAGRWQVKHPVMIRYHAGVYRLLSVIRFDPPVAFEHVRREANEEADGLSRFALGAGPLLDNFFQRTWQEAS